MTKNKQKFGDIVRGLMESRGLKSAELGNLLGMPRASIQRLVKGVTQNPSANTLIALAGFFNVTVDHLLGNPTSEQSEPIFPVQSSEPPKNVPVLDWSQVKNWLYAKQELDLESFQWIPVKNLAPSSFAIKINKHPLRHTFPMDSVIIIDPEEKYENNNYVLTSIDKNIPTVRRITEELGGIYLNPVGMMIPSVLLEPPHTILGKVVECRFLVD